MRAIPSGFTTFDFRESAVRYRPPRCGTGSASLWRFRLFLKWMSIASIMSETLRLFMLTTGPDLVFDRGWRVGGWHEDWYLSINRPSCQRLLSIDQGGDAISRVRTRSPLTMSAHF